MSYPGAGRLVYAGFMQLTGFMSMNMDRHFGAHVKLFEHLVTGRRRQCGGAPGGSTTNISPSWI